ncbi:MAG: NTP transferase domain-containing protein [Methanobacterium sp.]|uniref:nucleotidyltransferase family protein n=1 Tax=Methanobacterium sp. TaxID=2164 RepID=UPI003C73827D
MVSAVITAAGLNRRMREDLLSKGMTIEHKLIMDLKGKPVIIRTIENVLESGVKNCVVVLGHYSEEINSVLKDFPDKRVKIIYNHDLDCELSETLLNGVKNIEYGLCLCVAADQPTVTYNTMAKLIENAINYENPENIVSILARKETGFLESAEGLGMPFVCHSKLLLNYLPEHKDNLNPILREMISNDVVFYGTPAINELELVNINRYNDYLYIKNKF